MIDIHCHPLPELDDGAESLEMAVAMCRLAAEDGITHIVATPHHDYAYKFDLEVSRSKLEQLQAAVNGNLQLLLGCDCRLSYDNLRQITQDRERYTINRTAYLLAELDDHFVPEHMDRVFFELGLAGIRPIITHPERNPVLQRKPELLYRWVTHGCLAQVTAMSYTGGFGRTAQSVAELILRCNLVHFFATDAHDTRGRPPILSPCYQKVCAELGRDRADWLCSTNPEAVIQGRELAPGAEPINPQNLVRKRSWYSFFRA